MYLCLDVGNTQIHGGVVDDDKLIMDFRLNTKEGWSSDQFGVVIRGILREREVKFEQINRIGIASVVSSIDYHLKNACLKYFNYAPVFIKAGLKTGVSVSKFKNPHEIGADLIAAAACALHDHPKQNLIIVDMGTATTITAVNKQHEFLGGIIVPGLQTQITSLANSAEKLCLTDIEKPKGYLGKTTTHSIQSGLYYGQLGALLYLISNAASETFSGEKYKVIGTGGFSRLYINDKLFDMQVPDLVLRGIKVILSMNE
jgi:type III pantothenate kinase